MVTVSLSGDPEYGKARVARRSDDPQPPMREPVDEPVDGPWTIPGDDGPIVVAEKLAAYAANTAAHRKRGWLP
jgi:hypothetical protein